MRKRQQLLVSKQWRRERDWVAQGYRVWRIRTLQTCYRTARFRSCSVQYETGPKKDSCLTFPVVQHRYMHIQANCYHLQDLYCCQLPAERASGLQLCCKLQCRKQAVLTALLHSCDYFLVLRCKLLSCYPCDVCHLCSIWRAYNCRLLVQVIRTIKKKALEVVEVVAERQQAGEVAKAAAMVSVGTAAVLEEAGDHDEELVNSICSMLGYPFDLVVPGGF